MHKDKQPMTMIRAESLSMTAESRCSVCRTRRQQLASKGRQKCGSQEGYKVEAHLFSSLYREQDTELTPDTTEKDQRSHVYVGLNSSCSESFNFLRRNKEATRRRENGKARRQIKRRFEVQ